MITRDLPVHLTADEQRLKGEQLAKLHSDRRHAESEKSRMAAEFTGKLKALDQQINDLADQVKECREIREVECHEHKDHTAGFVYLIRDDTGEIVESRAIRPDERQVEMLPVPRPSDEAEG